MGAVASNPLEAACCCSTRDGGTGITPRHPAFEQRLAAKAVALRAAVAEKKARAEAGQDDDDDESRDVSESIAAAPTPVRSMAVSFTQKAPAAVSKLEERFDADSSDEEDEEEPLEVPLEELPSLGSKDHFKGSCKRCCFFPKGRCTNGYDCEFCHYDHDKRQRKKKKRRSIGGISAASLPEGGLDLDLDDAASDAEENTTADGGPSPIATSMTESGILTAPQTPTDCGSTTTITVNGQPQATFTWQPPPRVQNQRSHRRSLGGRNSLGPQDNGRQSPQLQRPPPSTYPPGRWHGVSDNAQYSGVRQQPAQMQDGGIAHGQGYGTEAGPARCYGAPGVQPMAWPAAQQQQSQQAVVQDYGMAMDGQAWWGQPVPAPYQWDPTFEGCPHQLAPGQPGPR